MILKLIIRRLFVCLSVCPLPLYMIYHPLIDKVQHLTFILVNVTNNV